jgi:hypothetical protein
LLRLELAREKAPPKRETRPKASMKGTKKRFVIAPRPGTKQTNLIWLVSALRYIPNEPLSQSAINEGDF